jgi:nucleotide-binding universal stress UspA family protein
MMYRKILVPIDLDEPSSWERALPVGVTLCQSLRASLALVTIVPDTRLMLEAQWSPIAFNEFVDSARARLYSLADTISGVGNVERHVEIGGVYASILAVAERTGVDLVVLAAHRPAMRDYLLGTNAARVVRHARCSVLVVRDSEQ